MASLVHKYPPQKYCPADAFAPWFNLFGHDPLKKKHVLSARTSGAAPGGAALFRDPRKRLWSAYQSLYVVLLILISVRKKAMARCTPGFWPCLHELAVGVGVIAHTAFGCSLFIY